MLAAVKGYLEYDKRLQGSKIHLTIESPSFDEAGSDPDLTLWPVSISAGHVEDGIGVARMLV
jgi:hypothetical protein